MVFGHNQRSQLFVCFFNREFRLFSIVNLVTTCSDVIAQKIFAQSPILPSCDNSLTQWPPPPTHILPRMTRQSSASTARSTNLQTLQTCTHTHIILKHWNEKALLSHTQSFYKFQQWFITLLQTTLRILIKHLDLVRVQCIQTCLLYINNLIHTYTYTHTPKYTHN